VQFQLVELDYCFACNPSSGVDFNKTSLKPEQFAQVIDDAAKEQGIDPALVRAIIHAESAFRPGAVSKKGAQGLMQLMPATASEMGVINAFDPTQNIRGGTKYLANLLKRYLGDTRLAAAAYNAGPGAVQKYGGVPPYRETQAYVSRVGILHERYKSAVN
jgi:soluble lytic murein transglycosylase-like protein